jgi:hypothetical protein
LNESWKLFPLLSTAVVTAQLMDARAQTPKAKRWFQKARFMAPDSEWIQLQLAAL